jgi:PAS domain S-box-containing protein
MSFVVPGGFLSDNNIVYFYKRQIVSGRVWMMGGNRTKNAGDGKLGPEKQASPLGAWGGEYSDLVDNAIVAIYQTTLGGKILRANENLARMFGCGSVKEIMDTGSALRYKDPADRAGLLEVLKKRGKVNGFEVELLTKSGESINVLLSATLKGGLISGMMLDITERRKAEELLRAKEQQYRRLIEAAPFPVVITRFSDNTLLYINQAASELFKVSMDDVVGRKAVDFYDDPRERALVIEQLLEKGFIKDYSLCFRNARGEQFWALMSTTQIVFNNEPAAYSSLNNVTELKQALTGLEESEARYRTLFDSANDAILLIDTDTDRCVDCNLKALATFRCTKQEIVGRAPMAFAPPFQPDGCNSREKALEMKRLALSGKPQVFEWKHLRKDGSVFDAEVSLNHIRIGAALLLQGMVRDVSERREVEQKVRLSEEKYRSIFDNAVEGIFQSTPQGRYLSANPALARMFGYDSPQDMINAVSDIQKEQYINPEDRPKLKDLFERQGYVERFGIAIRRRDGERVWISMNARAARDRDGRIIYYEGFVEDITSRKVMEEALRESEERYKTFIDSTSDMVFLKDDRFRNIIVNKSLLKFSGKAEEEIIGKTDLEFMPAAGANFARLTDIKASKSSSIVISEQAIGDRIYETRKFPVSLKGNVTGVGGFIRDITEQKRSEEDLRIKSLNLEEVNAALRVLLRQIERDKGELEERILFNVKKLVFPYVDILKRRKMDEEQKMYLHVIESNLKNIVSPFVQKMMYAFSGFTPTEILVANFVKEGRTVKEISAILGVSENAVNRHRQHVRNKLGLNKRKINLKVYLMSLK